MTEPTTHSVGQPAAGEQSDGHDPVPELIDWLIGILTAVVGLGVTAAGIGMFARVDKAMIEDAVTAEGVQLEGLTPAEAVTAGDPFVDWLAAGFIVTGIGLLAGGALFVALRRRTRRRVRRTGGTTATFWACAVYGAATSIVLSFVPGSSLLGGGAAGYLYDDDEIRVGAAAALVGGAATVPLTVCLAVGFLAGASAIGELAGGALIAALVIIGELLALTITAALGAAGGYLSNRLL